MIRVWCLATVLVFVTGAPPLLTQSKPEEVPLAAPAAVEAALAKVAPTRVGINVVTVSHSGGREIKREASGRGTIITAGGHVVTNHRVAGRTRHIVCTLPTREEIPAEL